MDVTQALKDAENSLRDFISMRLQSKFGSNWIEHCGITNDRLAEWRGRKLEESKTQASVAIEERLIYYADFYDLGTILKKHWNDLFKEVFDKQKNILPWLKELEKYRNPDAHRRELLPHQKHLVLGISGEIRSRIVRFRSSMETENDCFPRIECVRDNYGNAMTQSRMLKALTSKTRLRPGDTIDIVVTASDPEGFNLEYGFGTNRIGVEWSNSNTFSLRISEDDISKCLTIKILIRSNRNYHAYNGFDDFMHFQYSVLPHSK